MHRGSGSPGESAPSGRQQSAFRCKYVAFAGIVSIKAGESGISYTAAGPNYSGLTATVTVKARWQCLEKDPTASAAATNSALPLACGKDFTIVVTASDLPNPGLATGRALNLAQERAVRFCAGLPNCKHAALLSASWSGAIETAPGKWQDTFTGKYRCM